MQYNPAVLTLIFYNEMDRLEFKFSQDKITLRSISEKLKIVCDSFKESVYDVKIIYDGILVKMANTVENKAIYRITLSEQHGILVTLDILIFLLYRRQSKMDVEIHYSESDTVDASSILGSMKFGLSHVTINLEAITNVRHNLVKKNM